jgi:HNH endonuclease
MRTIRESHSGGKRCRPIQNLPAGDAPACKCRCGTLTSWNRRKNKWNVYADGHYRQDAPYKNADWLRTEYETKQRTIDELASECGVNQSTIRKFMLSLGIPSRDASAAHAGRQAGTANPAWRGGVAQWEYSSDWKRLARQVRQRDKYTCQDCREQRRHWGAYLHVHHIDEDKLNNDLANLISLCAACHRKRHGAAKRSS